jgi:hypothetical protein
MGDGIADQVLHVSEWEQGASEHGKRLVFGRSQQEVARIGSARIAAVVEVPVSGEGGPPVRQEITKQGAASYR